MQQLDKFSFWYGVVAGSLGWAIGGFLGHVYGGRLADILLRRLDRRYRRRRLERLSDFVDKLRDARIIVHDWRELERHPNNWYKLERLDGPFKFIFRRRRTDRR